MFYLTSFLFQLPPNSQYQHPGCVYSHVPCWKVRFGEQPECHCVCDAALTRAHMFSKVTCHRSSQGRGSRSGLVSTRSRLENDLFSACSSTCSILVSLLLTECLSTQSGQQVERKKMHHNTSVFLNKNIQIFFIRHFFFFFRNHLCILKKQGLYVLIKREIRKYICVAIMKDRVLN